MVEDGDGKEAVARRMPLAASRISRGKGFMSHGSVLASGYIYKNHSTVPVVFSY